MHSLTGTLPEQSNQAGTGGYSRKQLQQAVQEYHSRFGDSVPLGLITAAASAFRSSELMSMLLDRVKANDPVQDWAEYSAQFLNSSQQ